MILLRLCNYFARCVQLDEFIRREQMGVPFVLHRHGPVECPSFSNPGLPHATNARVSPGTGAPFRSLPPFGIFRSGHEWNALRGRKRIWISRAATVVGAWVHVFMKAFCREASHP